MLLKLGSQGPDVSTLQEKLGLTPDGIFGQDTLLSVKNFQSGNGLVSDGIVGDGTWNKLIQSENDSSTVNSQEGIFKLDKLIGYIPQFVIDQIPDVSSKFNINNILRLTHFLAQCAHESGKFTLTHENLNYETSGLLRVFPVYFPTKEIADLYRMQPEKIGSRVYGSRMGNGPESTKEGYKFSGKGFLQLTGKSNYQDFSTFIGEDCVSNPSLVETKYPLASAAWFFNTNNLWYICDSGSDRISVENVTRHVNGGLLGIENRWSYFQQYYTILK